MMFSVSQSRGAKSVTLTIAGSVGAETLPTIDRLITDGMGGGRRVVLDLEEVTLMDREAARFFALQALRGVELANCPLYLQHWISPRPVEPHS